MTRKVVEHQELELEDGQEFSDITELDNLEVEPEVEAKPAPEIDPAYANKTLEELIEMNKEAQRQISRQGNEIGELRGLTDQILQKTLIDATTRSVEPEPEVDWEYNPKEAAERLVKAEVSAIEAKLEAEARQRALSEFAHKHPNYKEVAADEKFRNWVAASPFRAKMYIAADNHDFEAADELFTEWESFQEATRESIEASDKQKSTKQRQALKDATMEKGGNTGASRKIYRRADLIKLRMTDPDAYEARADEISLAYREGRVK